MDATKWGSVGVSVCLTNQGTEARSCNGYLSSSGASIIRVPNCRAKITISGEKRIIKRFRQHN